MAHFYLDENLPIAVAWQLLIFGHTAQTVRDMQRLRASDDYHLLLAAQLNAIFVTRNRSDFVLLHNAWSRWSRAWNVEQHHPGIIVTPHAWLADRTATELAGLVAGTALMQNRLYEWRQERWIEVVPPL